MINAISTALSGLIASGKRAEASASNIANLGSSGSIEPGGKPPYQPLTVQQTSNTARDGTPLGVKSEFIPKEPGITPSFSPDSPFANEEGIIGVPNVNLAEEAVNLKIVELSYKANVNTIEVAGEMQEDLLRVFDDEA